MASINPNMGFTPNTPITHGRGREIASTFQEASFAQTDGYQGTNTLAEMGLRNVAKHHMSTDREQLVAQVAMDQLKSLDANLTTRTDKDSISSRSIALSESLAYIAAGGVASGPVGAILADLGSRQMDSIRGQSFNTASPADVRDSNVAGVAMLQQLGGAVDDTQLMLIAQDALDKVGDRYLSSEKERKIGGDFNSMMDDSKVIFQAFDDIKAVACRGDANNPKSIAFLAGEMPEGNTSVLGGGRPGGRVVDYPSRELGFGVSKERKHDWDR